MMNQLLNDVIIAGVSFADTAIEITYFQKASQAEGIQLMETMTIDIDSSLSPLAEEILDNPRDLVDEGLLKRRNPPQKLTPKMVLDD